MVFQPARNQVPLWWQRFTPQITAAQEIPRMRTIFKTSTVKRLPSDHQQILICFYFTVSSASIQVLFRWTHRETEPPPGPRPAYSRWYMPLHGGPESP